MVFAIRDDDTSYFTTPEELETAFSDIPDIPISLSVVPDAVGEHGDENPYGEILCGTQKRKIGDNTELTAYIRTNITSGRYEVLMHGIHHQYRREKDLWIPEMCYLTYDQIREVLPEMRKYLQELFECDINTFVAPSNSMNRDSFRLIEELGMNTMCTLSKKFDHPFSWEYLLFYLSRNIRKMLHMDEYTRILNYRNHKELTIAALDSFDQIWPYYCRCKKYNLPVIIYTHYWELNRYPEKKKLLKQITEAMISDGAKACFVSDCFKGEALR